MSDLPTIVAVASGWGCGPLGLVRLSGNGVTSLTRRVLTSVELLPGRIVATDFRLNERTALPCWSMFGLGPRTYTGEDTLELLLPGNPLILERVIARLCEPVLVNGVQVREANPGEFSARAFLNGKLSLDQAEGVAAIIAAQNDRQLAAAEALSEGRTGNRYRAWAEQTATMLALVEAGIDFTDQEDVVPIAPRELSERIGMLRESITSELGGSQGNERVALLPRVVLAGPPNAGKSTLFNTLLGRRRAVESSMAGTTRDVLEEPLDLSLDVPGGARVVLMDVAGCTEDLSGHVHAAAQRSARAAIEGADVVVLCDPRGRFEHPLAKAGNEPHGGGRSTIRVRTKADLPMLDGPGSGVAGGEGVGAAMGSISLCAIDGWNISVLKRAIADALWAETGVDDTKLAAGLASAGKGTTWLLPRHRRALSAVATHLAGAILLIEGQRDAIDNPETVAGELRAALNELAELTGAISPDDIIGRVFATFCVGK